MSKETDLHSGNAISIGSNNITNDHGEIKTCNTPKYTLVVFDMFRVFCKHNLNVSKFKCETWKLRNSEFVQYTRENL